MKVEISLQAADFVRRQAPEPRRRLRRALRDLAKGKGDIIPLEGPLTPDCRLSVGGYRIIVSYAEPGAVQCIFAERRSIVYEVFARVLADKLAGVDDT